MTTIRLKGPQRRRKILAAALNISALYGYKKITRAEVATAACVARGLVNHYFSTMEELRNEIIREAIRQEQVQIIAQGLSVMDPIALNAPDTLKERAAAWMIS